MLKALKDNLSLVAILVVLSGTSSTEAYYSSFGLKYQLLNLPASHILYRGLTAALTYVPLAALYILVLALMVSQSRLALLFGGPDRVRFVNHALIVALVIGGWFGGRQVGLQEAVKDSSTSKTTLPLVKSLTAHEQGVSVEVASPAEGYHVVLQTGAGLYLIQTVNNAETEKPLVRFISSGSIESATICASC